VHVSLVSLWQAAIYWDEMVGAARAAGQGRGRPPRHSPDCVAQPDS